MIIKIGEKISELRNRQNLTQQGLARSLGVTRSSVNAWEMGISHPSIEKIIDIAEFFHVTTDYLLGLDDSLSVDISALSDKEKTYVINLISILLEVFRTSTVILFKFCILFIDSSVKIGLTIQSELLIDATFLVSVAAAFFAIMPIPPRLI